MPLDGTVERLYGPEPETHPKSSQGATAYIAPDPAKIPPRPWLYGRHYMRGIISATVAPGGFGKTTLSLYETLCMVCEEDLRVWYVSAEDDRNEIDRRIAAHFKKHNLDRLDIADRLFVDDKMSFAFKIARTDRNNNVLFDDVALARFEQSIAFSKIDVVILDPFISFHNVVENDTGAMDAVVKRLGEIAARQACNIELSHHVRKPSTAGSAEITVYDARGAGSIVNAVRSCRVLNQMSKTLAEQLNPPISDKDRHRFIRVDSGKRNMAPPESASWRELHNVEIENGDFVQALDHFELQIQTTNPEEDKQWLRTVMFEHGAFRVSSQSKENWLGTAMAKHFKRDAESEGDKKWLNKLIKKWERDDFIKKDDEIRDENRIKRPHWVLGDNIEMETVNDSDGS